MLRVALEAAEAEARSLKTVSETAERMTRKVEELELHSAGALRLRGLTFSKIEELTARTAALAGRAAQAEAALVDARATLDATRAEAARSG